MTPNPSKFEAVSLPDVKRFLVAHGFTLLGQWGAYLERYHLEHGDDVYDVILPTSRDIADYGDRMRDALKDLAKATDLDIEEIFSRVAAFDFRAFRIRAHPGADIASIPFDEGYALLSSGKDLIRLSAVSAFSPKHKKGVRGRVPVAVDDYMDRVQLGQTAIGSYVFTLLLPPTEVPFESTNAAIGEWSSEDPVLSTLESSLALAAEIGRANRVPSADDLAEVGVSSNFFRSLYEMVDWSEEITLEVEAPSTSVIKPACYSFSRRNLAALERTALKLAPDEARVKTTISGTITRVSEPQIRRRGSLDLRVRVGGRVRSVRVIFGFEDRETVIDAFRDKASRYLTVSGFLRTESNGHLTLDEPHGFSASRRGELA